MAMPHAHAHPAVTHDPWRGPETERHGSACPACLQDRLSAWWQHVGPTLAPQRTPEQDQEAALEAILHQLARHEVCPPKRTVCGSTVPLPLARAMHSLLRQPAAVLLSLRPQATGRRARTLATQTAGTMRKWAFHQKRHAAHPAPHPCPRDETHELELDADMDMELLTVTSEEDYDDDEDDAGPTHARCCDFPACGMRLSGQRHVRRHMTLFHLHRPLLPCASCRFTCHKHAELRAHVRQCHGSARTRRRANAGLNSSMARFATPQETPRAPPSGDQCVRRCHTPRGASRLERQRALRVAVSAMYAAPPTR